MDQMLISISRELGSGGHDIGVELGKRFGIDVYDADLLEKVAVEYGLDYEEIKRHEEKPRRPIVSRSFGGHSSAVQDHIAELEFKYIREMIDDGKSFLLIGRCGDWLMRGNERACIFHVIADDNFRIARIMNQFDLSGADASQIIKRTDRSRASYHERMTKTKWGDPANYDMVINSARLGISGTTDMMESYVRQRLSQ